MSITLPHSGSATSRAAARAAVPKSAHDRRLIAEFIAKQGANGATDDELAVALPEVNANAIRPRRGECWGHEMITDTIGERRATRTGCMATVWHITKRGIEALGLPAESWCVRWPA